MFFWNSLAFLMIQPQVQFLGRELRSHFTPWLTAMWDQGAERVDVSWCPNIPRRGKEGLYQATAESGQKPFGSPAQWALPLEAPVLPGYQRASSSSSLLVPFQRLPFSPPTPPHPFPHHPIPVSFFSLSLGASLGTGNWKPQFWFDPHVLHLRKLEQEKGKIEDLKIHSSPSTSKIKKKKKKQTTTTEKTLWHQDKPHGKV